MGYLGKVTVAINMLKLNDKIAIILSVLAIILSGVSIYYQFLYSKEELLLTVTEVNLDTESKSLKLDIALINSGTEPFLITSYILGIKNAPDSGLRMLGPINDLTNSIGKAFTVKPDEIKIKTLNVDLSDNDIHLLQTKECLPYDLFVSLIIVGNNGKHYSNDTQLANVNRGVNSSLIEIYRDLIDVLRSEDIYRKHNEVYISKGFVNYKELIGEEECFL